MTSVLLVRHASSVPPTTGGPNEWLRPLTAQGYEQAETLVQELVSQGPTRFVSSPYKRAVDSVAPAAAAARLPVVLDPELREWVSGMPAKPDWQREYRRAWENPHSATGPGESHAELQARALRAFEHLVSQASAEDVLVLSSHGTWISRLLSALGCFVNADFWFAMPMPAVYCITDEGGPIVRGPGLPGA